MPRWESEPVIKELNTMQAIIVTGGKQYKVAEGDTLFIEKLEAEAGHAALIVYQQNMPLSRFFCLIS